MLSLDDFEQLRPAGRSASGDADAIGAGLAGTWEEDLRYRHYAGYTIETASDHVTLRAVTQIAPGGFWVTATVRVDLA